MLTSPAHSEALEQLTKLYFGDHVASTMRTLLNYDQASLKAIRATNKCLTIRELKKSLLILIKYQLVDYAKTVKNCSHQYDYFVVPARVFSFFRISRYIQSTDIIGQPMRISLLTTLIERGLLSRTKLILLTLQKENLDESKSRLEIEDHIDTLLANRFIVQTSTNYSINLERFERKFRDDLVIDSISDYYKPETRIRHLCHTILHLSTDNTPLDSPITSPVPLADLQRILIPQHFTDREQLDNYLGRLVTETSNKFFVCSGNHPMKGPMYAINLGLVIEYLVKEHMSSLVTAKFGPKCCRVFRVLLAKGPMLMKQIEEIIMLPARDVREYSYMLIKEGYIKNRQVPKTPDNAPGKSIFVMSVEMDTMVFRVADMCCSSISNLSMRREYEFKNNKTLVERAKAAKELLVHEGADRDNISVEEWNQYFNSHELSKLGQINKNLDRLMLARTQVDETLFLLHSWMNVRHNMGVE